MICANDLLKSLRDGLSELLNLENLGPGEPFHC